MTCTILRSIQGYITQGDTTMTDYFYEFKQGDELLYEYTTTIRDYMKLRERFCKSKDGKEQAHLFKMLGVYEEHMDYLKGRMDKEAVAY